MRISDYFFSPALASLMEKRRHSLFLGGVVTLQFGLVTAGLPGWPCPFKAAFGIPCPGCGLSTSVSCLFHGDWQGAFATHAFAPIFLIGLVFVLAVSILPEAPRSIIVQKIAALEKRTGITTLFMISLMCYWGFRLLKL
jgi:hypothetical protein